VREQHLDLEFLTQMPPKHGSTSFDRRSACKFSNDMASSHTTPLSIAEADDMRARLPISIISGLIAIVINTLALKLADLIWLPTAHGGLLRLISPWFAAPLRLVGISGLWVRLGGPLPSTSLFQTGFHIAVGIAMAVFYALFVEPSWRGRAISKGLAFAASVWILNAAIVLPLTGEGFAGSAHLSVAGMIWFAAAHTLFFVLLALLFQALNAPETGRAPRQTTGQASNAGPLADSRQDKKAS
jgi:hypothetical protein